MALRSSIAVVRGDIQDILQSGNYYVTEEVARELSNINNGLEHLALDSNFLSTSKEWSEKPGNYTAREANDQLAGAMSAISQIHSGLAAYKTNLANRNVAGRQENELRELHQWAISSLTSAQQCLEPFTLGAADRIKQFGDTIGVTDRYTGYRANLTRGSRDPFKLESTWMNKQGEQGLMNSLARSKTTLGPGLDHRVTFDPRLAAPEHFGAAPPANRGALQKHITFGDDCSGGAPRSLAMDEVKALNALNASAYCQKTAARPKSCGAYLRMSVQEQAGINTTFPGKTEYMLRYKSPVDPNVAGGSDFRINPAPNFGVYGRPMMSAKYIPNFTEYQTRYEWPDAEKIVKKPWLRL